MKPDPNQVILAIAEDIRIFRRQYTEADRLLREHCDLVPEDHTNRRIAELEEEVEGLRDEIRDLESDLD